MLYLFQEDYEDLLNNAIYCLQGFKVLMNVCPEAQSLSENQDEILSIRLKNFGEPVMIQVTKDDVLWRKVDHLVDSLLIQLKAMKKELSRTLPPSYFAEFAFVSNETRETITCHLKTLSDVQRGVAEIHNLFSLETCDSPLTVGIAALRDKISMFLEKYSDFESDTFSSIKSDFGEGFKSKLSKLIHKLLLIVQELYKKFCVFEEEKTEENPSDDEGEDDEVLNLKNQHLTEEIIASLDRDMALIELKAVNKTLGSLLEQLTTTHDSEEGRDCKRFVSLFLSWRKLVLSNFKLVVDC